MSYAKKNNSKKYRGRTDKDDDQKVIRKGSRNASDKMKGLEDGTPNTRGNDVSWYTKNEQLVRDAASIPYSYPLGGEFGTYAAQRVLPGLMTLQLVTGPGISDSENSPVNIAARDIYSYVRHKNSGHSNYDPNDLMSYLLAVDEAYMLYFNAVRAYGAMNLYNNENRYGPQRIVEGLGWDYSDLNANLAQFRYAINAYTVKLNALCVPSKLPYFQRHAWLYSGIYSDSMQPKAQLYAFAPAITRVRNDATGHLECYDLKTAQPLTDKTTIGISAMTQSTVADWIKISNLVINNLLSSEDIGIISGDILKAYGRETLITIPAINDDYRITPTYSPEILSQIENATVLGGVANANIIMDNAINAGTVLYNPICRVISPTFTGTAPKPKVEFLIDEYGPANLAMINMRMDNPTPGDTMVATRLTSTCSRDDLVTWDDTTSKWIKLEKSVVIPTTGVFSYLTEIGTEVVCGVHYVKGTKGTEAKTTRLPNPLYMENGILEYTAGYVADFMNFDYAPQFTLSAIIDKTSYWAMNSHYLCDYDMYAKVYKSILGNMHQCAILAQLDVPIMY